MHRLNRKVFVAILLIILLAGCSPQAVTVQGGNETMPEKTAKPQIDLLVPERLETAVFALG